MFVDPLQVPHGVGEHLGPASCGLWQRWFLWARWQLIIGLKIQEGLHWWPWFWAGRCWCQHWLLLFTLYFCTGSLSLFWLLALCSLQHKLASLSPGWLLCIWISSLFRFDSLYSQPLLAFRRWHVKRIGLLCSTCCLARPLQRRAPTPTAVWNLAIWCSLCSLLCCCLDLAAVLLGAAFAFAFDFRTFATLLFAAVLSLALAKASALVLAMACWRPGKS